jgi:hypothetical protein
METDETPGKREREHGMADDDDHFFSLGFFKNGIHALVRCLLAWDGIQHSWLVSAVFLERRA